MNNAVAIMQPYIFPYVGYMNLVFASDTFVFYDDVNFIKRGWINRNRIILSGAPYRFVIPLCHSTQNRLIKDIELKDLHVFTEKFIGQIYSSYKGSTYFKQALEYLEGVLYCKTSHISDLAEKSVRNFFDYLDIEKKFMKSSANFSKTVNLKGKDRLAAITKELGSSCYLNAEGGASLYSKSDFRRHGISLFYVNPLILSYNQCNSGSFVGRLSIIDLMMNLSKKGLRRHIKSFRLD